MPTLKILQNTIAKLRPVQSSALPADQRFPLQQGRDLDILAYKKTEGDHIVITFATAQFNGLNTFYLFGPHIEVWEGDRRLLPSSELRLDVPFYQQVDNKHEPMRTCNTSACGMVARFMGANISGDDQYYQVVRKYGDTTDHGAQTRALAEIGIHSTWHTNLGYADLDRSLEAGLPIVIGILHRGSLSSPTGGHMVVVIGRTASKDYICHDPFGSLLDSGGGYTGDVNNGRGVVYPRSVLDRRWLAEGPRSGWGRLFQR